MVLLASEPVATLLYVARNGDTAEQARTFAAVPPNLLAALELPSPLDGPLEGPPASLPASPLVSPLLLLFLFPVKAAIAVHVEMALLAMGTVRILVCVAQNGDTAEQAVISAAAVLLGQLHLKPSQRNRKRESGPLIFQIMLMVTVPASATS
jgi:hypothetical protein